MATVTVFIGYSLGVAVVVALTPLATFLVYAGGLASFIVAIEAMQPPPTARLMMLPNGVSTTVVSIALALLLFAARRRDFAQRLTISKQRAELTKMNVGLEQRVRDQVSEIVERARQIKDLNTQLQAQVRTRSTELSMALAKLARDWREDGSLRSGVVLGDRFVVDALLGEGGMGSVYSGTDRSTGARVAIKVIQASSAQQLDALHRFLREAGTAAKVTHPAVVRMLHVDVSADGVLFQVQELVDGETLHARLRDQRPWDGERVARLGGVLCDALAAAHAVGVVHRDVKPGNVMLTKTAPGLKLLDFGISKVFREGGRAASSGSGKILGTPAYMAPEHLAGSGKLTDRADVYAAGVIFFRMLTGKFPFDGASTREVIMRNVVEPAPRRSNERAVRATRPRGSRRTLPHEGADRAPQGERSRARAHGVRGRPWSSRVGNSRSRRLEPWACASRDGDGDRRAGEREQDASDLTHRGKKLPIPFVGLDRVRVIVLLTAPPEFRS